MAHRSLYFLSGVLLLCVLLAVSRGSSPDHTDEEYSNVYKNESCTTKTDHCAYRLGPDDNFPIASLNWEEVKIPVTVGIWILFSSLARIASSFTPVEKYIPESCILICFGFVIGLVSLLINVEAVSMIRLDADLFFIYLLPPIMLEAGYFMPMRAFTSNLYTILLFAVIGTLFNAVTVGLSLFAVSELGWLGGHPHPTKINFLECFIFSSLISAVDPVAVLAVFDEIHVNQVLYILVFGESLLNDAVTVVLYRMFETFNEIGQDNLDGIDIFSGVMSFFVVSVGGVLVGIIFGFLTALVSRFVHHIRVIEPMFVFIMSYMAYLIAELLSLSSIMAIVTCAMVMKPYVERNISSKSHTTIKYSMKMLSSLSETLIFILLGISAINHSESHQWNTSFVIFTLIFTFVYRFIGVAWQCFLANRYRLIKINSREKFIMAYGGIRGAIAFSLAALLCDGVVLGNKIFLATTIVVVMFTMFIQGMTIKPLVNKLNVKKEEKCKPSMNEEIFSRVNDHILAGMELILGHEGRYYFKGSWKNFDDKYLKKLLIRDHRPIRDPKILDVYQKLTEKDATAYIKEHGTFHLSASVSNFLRTEIGSSAALMYNPSSASLSGSRCDIPMGEGVTCLDMHATDVHAVPERVKQESLSGHSEILSKNMYRPHTVYPTSKISMGPAEPPSLMYRSMKIQIDHKLKKRKRRHYLKRSKSSMHQAKESDTKILAPPALVIHQPRDDEPTPMNNCPAPLSPEEDEGITFTASRSDDCPAPSSPEEDEGITFTASRSDDTDETDGDYKMSIQESSVPWKLNEMIVTISEKASQDPHDEFGNTVPTAPSVEPTSPSSSNSAEFEVDEGEKRLSPLHDLPEHIEVKITIEDGEGGEGVKVESTFL